MAEAIEMYLQASMSKLILAANVMRVRRNAIIQFAATVLDHLYTDASEQISGRPQAEL